MSLAPVNVPLPIRTIHYKAANGKNFKAEKSLHERGLKMSEDICKGVAYGHLENLKECGMSQKEFHRRFKGMYGIVTSMSTIKALKDGVYKHINVLVLCYLAAYWDMSLIELYCLGKKFSEESIK